MHIAILAFALASPTAAPAVNAHVETHVVQTLEHTITGQAIGLPQAPVRVTISEMIIPAGGRLPPHRHPYARYVHVLAGRIAVKDLTTGLVVELGPNDWAVDVVETLHEGQAVGADPVRLQVIEQAPVGDGAERLDEPRAPAPLERCGSTPSAPPPVDSELEGARFW